MTIDRNTMEWHFLKLHGSVLRSGPFLMKLYRWNVENHVEAYPDFTENLRNLAYGRRCRSITKSSTSISSNWEQEKYSSY